MTTQRIYSGRVTSIRQLLSFKDAYENGVKKYEIWFKNKKCIYRHIIGEPLFIKAGSKVSFDGHFEGDKYIIDKIYSIEQMIQLESESYYRRVQFDHAN